MINSASTNDPTLKSLGFGLAAGLTTSVMVYMLSSGQTPKQIAAKLEKDVEEERRRLDQEDETGLEELKDEMRKELQEMGREPEFGLTIGNKEPNPRLFSKDFTRKLHKISHKYLHMGHLIIEQQQEDRRLAALESNDDAAYAKAFYEKESRIQKIACETEDILFDHFGIIECQFEAS